MDARDDVAVANRDKDGVRERSDGVLHEFPDLEGSGFLALGGEGIVAGVATVPAELLRSLDGQVEGIVVGAVHQHDPGAEDQQLRHLGRGRRLGRKDDRLLPHRRRHARQRRARITRGSSHNHLGFDLASARHHDCAGAVLEGSGRVAGFVLEPQLLQAKFFGQDWHLEDRRPARQRAAVCRHPGFPGRATGAHISTGTHPPGW